MIKVLLKVQVAVLAAATVFSWFTLLTDYRRFFAAGGHAFVWAVAVLRSAPGMTLRHQRGLNWLLTAGTVFAWGNFGYEVYRFSQPQPSASAFSCTKEAALVNPLMTPCFYGAIFYLTALVVSMFILGARAPRA
jgi:hypothetical protein